MGIDNGAGTPIKFSEIQTFYGGEHPISISEYNRGGDLVPQSVTGAAVSDNGTASKQVDSFDVDVLDVDGPLQTTGVGNSASITSTTSYIKICVNGNGNHIYTTTYNGQSTQRANYDMTHSTLNSRLSCYVFGGPQYVSGDGGVNSAPVYPVNTTCGGGGTGAASFQSAERGTRSILYDVTFQNESSGSTYTLTGDSSGTETVYSPGEQRTVEDNVSSNSWVLTYDRVTGSGNGTHDAGPITVTVANNGTYPTYGTAFNVTSTNFNTYFYTADSGANSNTTYRVNSVYTPEKPGDGDAGNGGIFISGTPTAYMIRSSNGPSGPLTVGVGTDGWASGYGSSCGNSNCYAMTGIVYNVQRITNSPKRKITFTNNTSSAVTLASGSTGGARTIAANASFDVQTGNTNNASWTVVFNSTAGNVNTNIPTTIGSGSPVNLDLFNAPGNATG